MAAPCFVHSSHCAPPCSPTVLPHVKAGKLKGIAVLGASRSPATPAQFSAFVAAETAKWGKLIREVGIRAD